MTEGRKRSVSTCPDEAVGTGNTENVQDLRYFYDAVGNITDTRDDAQQTVFFNNTVVEPHQAFEYDALYRLVYASGREHVSLGQPANTEYPVGPLANPNDPQALRSYVERYDYDNVGNILQMRHEAVGGAGRDATTTPRTATACWPPAPRVMGRVCTVPSTTTIATAA